MKSVYQTLVQKKIKCFQNISLKDYTTLHIGGKASLLTLPISIEEIITVIHTCKQHHCPYYILGKGSNVLALDQGYDGMIIVLSHFRQIEMLENEKLKISSGMTLKQISNYCIEHSLTGFEFACGIPGTIGGAVFMNAGAYGGEMKDIVVEVTYLDQNMGIQIISLDQLDFGYRKSFFSVNQGIVLEVVIQLEKGNKTDIQEKVDHLMALRRSKQPLDEYSAGSTFKRPKGHYASALIKDLGLQGLNVGDAEVSKKHAGFLINRGHATSQDFLNLIREVQQRVKTHTGYELECEIKIIDNKNVI